ncbi:hypothetical protein [Zhongshania sp.]|uniref:hypothetical protein n=1 Tax=Zhongshania sp. TaxID=1971902 RepID=UPI0035685A53
MRDSTNCFSHQGLAPTDRFRCGNKPLPLDASTIPLFPANASPAQFRGTKGATKAHGDVDHNELNPDFVNIHDDIGIFRYLLLVDSHD